MRCKLLLLQIVVTTTLFLVDVGESHSTGAGACTKGDLISGDPALKPHRVNNAISGNLQKNGFQVLLDGDVMKHGTPIDINALEPYTIEIKAPTSKHFRGFLVRIEDPRGFVDTFDYLFSLFGEDQVQISEICTQNEEVGGLTHTSNQKKTSASGILLTEYVDPGFISRLIMDVTVVVQNRNSVSEWYHSRFHLHSHSRNLSINPDPAPTPTSSPTTSPTSAPTKRPTPMPTQSPTTPPTIMPTKPPTGAPTKTPSKPPSPSPTKTPTVSPTTPEDHDVSAQGGPSSQKKVYPTPTPTIQTRKKKKKTPTETQRANSSSGSNSSLSYSSASQSSSDSY